MPSQSECPDPAMPTSKPGQAIVSLLLADAVLVSPSLQETEMSQTGRRGLDLQGSHQPESALGSRDEPGSGLWQVNKRQESHWGCGSGDRGMQKPRPVAYGQRLGTLSKDSEDPLHKNQFYDRSSIFLQYILCRKKR